MRFKVVGSAAGGGFPQWNSNDRLSRAVRSGAPGVRERTQSSLIASADGRNWVLFNASPDIRQQIAVTPELHPAPDGPAARQPDQGGRADQCRCRSRRRPAQPARAPALRPLRRAARACRHSPRTPSSTCSTRPSCPDVRCRRAASRWPTQTGRGTGVWHRRLPGARQGGALPGRCRSPGCRLRLRGRRHDRPSHRRRHGPARSATFPAARGSTTP